MRSLLRAALLALVLPGLCLAQTGTEDWSPPPLIPAQPDPAPPPPAPEGAPAAPGVTPPSNSPHAPYEAVEPPAEIGLMVSEVAFGALTAAGVSLLPYLLMKESGAFRAGGGISDIVLLLVFSAVPLAVSQTQLSLANGSRFYYSESWPASLSGLAAQAAVVGLFYGAMGGLSGITTTHSGGETFLLVGSIAFVPLVEMAVINLAKTPRHKLPYGGRGLVQYQPGEGLRPGLPTPSPIVGPTRDGLAFGLQLPLARGAF